jgi:hypothetical protein
VRTIFCFQQKCCHIYAHRHEKNATRVALSYHQTNAMNNVDYNFKEGSILDRDEVVKKIVC